jgi:hypothetical protein
LFQAGVLFGFSSLPGTGVPVLSDLAPLPAYCPLFFFWRPVGVANVLFEFFSPSACGIFTVLFIAFVVYIPGGSPLFD